MQGLQGVEVLASAEFRAFHAQSERLVKVLVVLQMVLFFVSFRTPKPFVKDRHKAI